MGKRELSPQEREFFARVRDAVFANPFSDARVQADLKIIGEPVETAETKRIPRLTDTVHRRLQALEQKGMKRLDQFAGPDQELVEQAFLFDFFHQFIKKFDALIPRQIAAGEKPVKVPFAEEALSLLQSRGFGQQRALHYLALCYQLRRAFYFIFRALVGKSRCMKALRESLWNNVFTCDLGLYNRFLWNRMDDFSTLILGETGTGKGTAAMAIGRSGFIPFDERSGGFAESFIRSFVSLDISQFPESLLESELFGHKKGAFTGATEDHEGIFDRCSPYGAIFLDEIGEISVPIQIKLLQVLQERRYSPVGSHAQRTFPGRVIGATNRPLAELRSKNGFRDDFYYRLCSDRIVVPPLRQRIAEEANELNELLAHTLSRILGEENPELEGMVEAAIKSGVGPDYPWPGNVRELEQAVRRILLNKGYKGDREAIPLDREEALVQQLKSGQLDAQALLREYCVLLYHRHGTYQEVARRTGLDRRTVKKYITRKQGR